MQKSIHIAKVDLSDTNEYMDTYLERLKQNKIINSRPLNHSHNNSTGNLLKSNEDSKKVITSYQEDRQKEKKQIDNLISVIDVVPRFKLEREYDNFIVDLMVEPPEKIIEKSYEKVIKEEMLNVITEDRDSLTLLEARILYSKKYPLDFLYQEWLSNDLNIQEELICSISQAVDDELSLRIDSQER